MALRNGCWHCVASSIANETIGRSNSKRRSVLSTQHCRHTGCEPVGGVVDAMLWNWCHAGTSSWRCRRRSLDGPVFVRLRSLDVSAICSEQHRVLPAAGGRTTAARCHSSRASSCSTLRGCAPCTKAPSPPVAGHVHRGATTVALCLAARAAPRGTAGVAALPFTTRGMRSARCCAGWRCRCACHSTRGPRQGAAAPRTGRAAARSGTGRAAAEAGHRAGGRACSHTGGTPPGHPAC